MVPFDLLQPGRRFRRRAVDAGATFDFMERHEAEEILAAARFVVALVYASLLGPYASPFSGLGAVLLAYVTYAAALYLAARRRAGLGPAIVIAVHAVDLLVPMAVAFVGAPSDHIARSWYASSALYLVPLVHAATRWGAGVTLATMVVAVTVALAQAGRPGATTFAPYDAITSLLIAGSLLAFLGLLEQRRAVHRTAIARLREGCQAAHGFKASMLIALRALAALFRARGARVTARSLESGRLVRWEYDADAPQEDRLRYVDAAVPDSSDPSGTSRAVQSWLTAGFSVGDWTGHIEIVKPAGRHRDARAVQFLERTVREVAPAVCHAYVQAHTRSRAAKEERAHLARELHDGPIQSLIGAEMGLEAVRRRADMDSATVDFSAQIAQAQSILRQEILTLRELMVRMKPLDLPPGELPTYLASAVRRFSQESGIRGEFVADDRSSHRLPRQHAVALARIVQEALINVRKHSGATRVVVALRIESGEARLTVHDNGRGFDPQQHQWTPTMIAESVRALGGRLTIDSSPGRGARLAIVIPLGAEAPALHQVAS